MRTICSYLVPTLIVLAASVPAAGQSAPAKAEAQALLNRQLGGGTVSLRLSGYQYGWRITYTRLDGAFSSRAAALHKRCRVQGPILIPVGISVVVTITSEDVIHELAVPELGLKIDGVPGRINTQNVTAHAAKRYYGGTNRTSGSGYGAMRVEFRAVSEKAFADSMALWAKRRDCQ